MVIFNSYVNVYQRVKYSHHITIIITIIIAII